MKIPKGEVTRENHKQWLADKVELYGEWHELVPVADGCYEARDPISELKEMVDPKKIIVVQADK